MPMYLANAFIMSCTVLVAGAKISDEVYYRRVLPEIDRRGRTLPSSSGKAFPAPPLTYNGPPAKLDKSGTPISGIYANKSRG